MKELRKERADRAARHDNRPFGAEGAPGTDGNRRGQWFQHGDFRLHAAAAEENGFERFGNAMAADLFRAVASHQTDDQSTGHRHGND